MGSTFDLLDKEVKLGIEGKNQSISIGLPKLGRYANIRKRIFTLIFSSTGAGKSALIDTIILNACDSYINSKSQFKLRPDFQLFSMERAKILRIAKWTSFLIFKKHGIQIEIPKMLGWWEDDRMSDKEYKLFLEQKDYVDNLLKEYITIYEGAKSPKEIYKILKDHFEAIGKYEEVEIKGRKHKVYKPNDENIVTIPIFDHINLTKTSQEYNTKKLAIDKLTEFCQGFRDLENAAPIAVAQVNRSISGVSRLKDGEHELILDDVKESGDVGDACDIAISIFNPLAFNQSSKTGYNPIDFVDKTNGSNYFRSCQILKSSYGQDSLRIPLSFNGFCGQFKELPKKNTLNDAEYQNLLNSVLNKTYFL